MPADLLEFEEPVGVLLKEIEALSMLPRTPEREKSIESLRSRADEIRAELYATLTPWQRVLVARHPNRPNTLDYVGRLFNNFDELHGDRRFADDHAIVCGFADYRGSQVAVVGHQKGRDTKQKVFRNFGYARPEGYRKALRVMQLAEKFSRPIVVFIDTPAAYPGIESEERGVAEAIAVNLREMSVLEVPIVVMVCGEGGSGGALGIAIGDRVLMQEYSVYSVIPPEGCAAILWRDANRKVEAAAALKITAPDLLALGLIDAIIPEPAGGAHNDHERATALVDQALSQSLAELTTLSVEERLDRRYDKFRQMGGEGRGIVNLDAPAEAGIDPRVKRLLWQHLPCDDAETAALGAALKLHPTVARLLCLRGFRDPELAWRFLNPSLDQLHDPFKLADMDRAVARLEQAIARKERIAIHGDYDVDGITSTVILRRALELLGGEVVHFIPDRLKDGYGLQPAAIDRLHADLVSLIVSVDCGIRGADAAARARELGIDLIITDHHEPDTTLPPAHAVINPKRHDCTYPDKHLAGVGVALKLVQALCTRAGKTKWLPAFVKIAAIGTLADVVPLVGENRIIARLGLASLSAGPHSIGLRALLDATGLTGKTIDSYQVAFMIAPRVNAAGRMSTPDIATRLLLAAGDAMEGEARDLAQQLNDENLRRQQEEAELVAQAKKAIETDPAVGAHNVLVVGGLGWHRGVIGIAASKLVDTYHKPAIVLSIEGDVAHGSCRSIPDFDMLGALERCADLFVRFGGHKQAAGLTMEAARVPEFRARINAYADDVLEPDQLRPRLRIDGPLHLKAITHDLVQGLDSMGPFGLANPRPIFHAGPVEIVDGPRSIKERHLKMTFNQEGRRFRAIAWRAAERAAFLEKHRAGVNLAFSLDRNEYRGETYLELSVADFKSLDGVE